MENVKQYFDRNMYFIPKYFQIGVTAGKIHEISMVIMLKMIDTVFKHFFEYDNI